MLHLVPRSKLLFCFSAVALPLALVAAAVPERSPVCAAFGSVFFVIAVADAVGARRSLAGIGVDLPAITRMSKDREGKIEVRIQNQAGRSRLLRLALGLPAEIPATNEEMDILLPQDSEWAQLVWTCRPHKRGNFRIRSIYMEGVSSFGFWAARKTHS